MIFGSNNQSTQPAPPKPDTRVERCEDRPQDTVEIIKFLPEKNSNIFATADWTGTVKVYHVLQKGNNVTSIQLKVSIPINCPIFSMHWLFASKPLIVVGCGDGSIKYLDPSTKKVQDCGRHEGLTGLELARVSNKYLILTVGIDKSLKGWRFGKNSSLFEKTLPCTPLTFAVEKTMFAISYSSIAFTVGLISCLARKGPLHYQISKLQSPINSIAVCSSMNPKLGLASVDGRIQIMALSKVEEATGLKARQIILYQGHKSKLASNVGQLFQVNSIGFHALDDNFFYSMGSNGQCVIWDIKQKNKRSLIQVKGVCFTSGDVSQDGSLFAYSSGYDWSEGVTGLEERSQAVHLYVRVLDEKQMMKKGADQGMILSGGVFQ